MPPRSGLRVVKGRWLTDHEPTPVFVINETLARQAFPGADPIGKRIRLPFVDASTSFAQVVGVVADLRVFEAGRGNRAGTVHRLRPRENWRDDADDSYQHRPDVGRTVAPDPALQYRSHAAPVRRETARCGARRFDRTAPIEPAVAGDIRSVGAAARDRRHLRRRRVCGGAANAGDRHPNRARRGARSSRGDGGAAGDGASRSAESRLVLPRRWHPRR